MRTIIPETMNSHVKELIGLKLNEITVHYFNVKFLFTGKENYEITINKKFMFGLLPSQLLEFVADASEHDLTMESANFIYLQGKYCAEAEISPKGLNIAFEGGGSLSVDFEDVDFEPIEFIGRSGNNNEKLKFYYAL